MTRRPCVITYNHQLPNIKEATNKQWDILKINPKLKTIFTEKSMMAYRKKHKSQGYIRSKTDSKWQSKTIYTHTREERVVQPLQQ